MVLALFKNDHSVLVWSQELQKPSPKKMLNTFKVCPAN